MPRPNGHSLNRAAWDDVLRLSGLSLTQVAELSDVPRPTLSLLRSGKNKASVPVAHKIATAIGVSPATLFPSLIPATNGKAVA